MAFTSLRASAEFESAVIGSVATFSPSADIQPGDTIVLGCCDILATTTLLSVSDNSTQPGSPNTYVTRPDRAGTAFSSHTAYINKATRKILTTDVITMQLDTTPTRIAGQMAAFVNSNGNPRFELMVGISADTTSPVAQGATGTLYDPDSLVVDFNFWKGGAVASGIAVTVPAGSTAIPGGGALSGGGSPQIETNGNYLLDAGSAATFTPSCTYTSITTSCGETLIFSDVLPVSTLAPQVRSVGAVGGGAFGAGITPNLPAFPQGDDLMLLFITLEESATLGGGSNPPSGWTSMGTPVSVAGGGILYGFYRFWPQGGTAPTLTWSPTTDGGETVMIAIHCDTYSRSRPITLYNTSSEATVDTSWSYNTSAISTLRDATQIWATVTSGFDLGSGQGSGTPTNASLASILARVNAQTAGGLGAGFWISSATKSTAGTLGTWAGTLLNATAKSYHMFAIEPWDLALVSISAATSSTRVRDLPRYLAPLSRIFGLFGGSAPAAPDVFAPPTSSRKVAYYRGSYSFNASAADQEIGLWADSGRSRQVAPYTGRSGVFGVYDTAAAPVADTWASVIYSQLRLPPPGPRSLALPPLVADQDEWADFERSRQWSSPAGRSGVFGVYDTPAAPAADTWSQVFYSQLRSPSPTARSLTRPPLVADQDEWAQVVYSQLRASPSGPRSLTRPPLVADQDEWAQAVYSRQMLSPRARSFVVSVADNPAAAAADVFAPLVNARTVAYYRGSYSLNASAADQAIPGDSWTQVFSSRPSAFYEGVASLVMASADEAIGVWAQITQAAWRPAPPLGRSSAISAYASPAAADTWAQVFQSVASARAERAASSAIFSTTADNDVWTQVFQSIIGARPTRPGSSAINAYVDAVVAADTWAQVAQSLRRARVEPGQSRFVSTFGLAAPDSFVALVQSRQRANYAAPRALFVPAFFALAAEFPPGGGGFGAEASAAWLRRYHAAYEGRYRGGYKSTLRKAK